MALTSTSFPVTQLPRSDFVMGHVKEVSDPWQGKLKDGLVGEFPLVTVLIIVWEGCLEVDLLLMI